MRDGVNIGPGRYRSPDIVIARHVRATCRGTALAAVDETRQAMAGIEIQGFRANGTGPTFFSMAERKVTLYRPTIATRPGHALRGAASAQ